MKPSDTCTCKYCKKVFCCAKCRSKHEMKNHAILVQVPIAKTQFTDIGEFDAQSEGSNSSIYVMCPICEEKPLVLYDEMYIEVLEHIKSAHLPLQCHKCAKVYVNIEDLKEFSQCSRSCLKREKTTESSSLTDASCDTNASKATIKQTGIKTTIATQTSPLQTAKRLDEVSSLVPFTALNYYLNKNKVTHEEFISDSVSSIKNLSSLSNSSIRHSLGVGPIEKAKLVRSTSTPVHAEILLPKPKEQAFNATCGQVSSIYHSGSDLDHSPALEFPNNTPSKRPLDNVNKYRKLGSRPRIATVTPLRQVMSKSIQKAFAEHCGIPCSTARSFGYNSTNDSSPLDLRLSPALRRIQNETHDSTTEKLNGYGKTRNEAPSTALRCDIVLSAQKLTTESVMIRRTKHLTSMETATTKVNADNYDPIMCNVPKGFTNQSSLGNDNSATGSIYKTCRSVEIFTSTEVSEINFKKSEDHVDAETADEIRPLQTIRKLDAFTAHNVAPITPITRIPGAVINKKLIQFEATPDMETDISKNLHQSTTDLFFTPMSTPMRTKSCLPGDSSESSGEIRRRAISKSLCGRPPIRRKAELKPIDRVEDIYDDSDDEVFLPSKQKAPQQSEANVVNEHSERGGRLWSLVSSVMRLPSLTGNFCKTENNPEGNTNYSSLLKRCASIAGSLVRTKSLTDETNPQSLKRKRTNTFDSQALTKYQYGSPGADTPSMIAEASAGSSKRFRIQARKPIERMRKYPWHTP